jgi:ABC-type Fe3+/spermidine/putrescine transport system ATPase subunit
MPPDPAPSNANEAADVRLIGIRKSFGGSEAVRGIDLAVRRGEFFSLLGPSGCGKTTTLRMIAGLERPSAGDIFIRSQRVNDVPINRRPTNLIFQRLALFPHLDVFDNIAFGLRLQRLPKAEIRRRVGEMLDVVHLSGFESRAVASLSGGQQQRVAIARAVVNQPAVLLLDEPLGALDLKLQIRLQEELKRIQRQLGITFVYVTHNQTEALTMSDRIAVMNDGRIEQLGPPASLYRSPRTTFVASFIGQTNLLRGPVRRTGDGKALVHVGGLDFLVPGEAADGQEATISVRPEQLRPAPPGSTWRGARLVVADATFLGVTILYRLRRPDGGTLLMQTIAGGNPAETGAALDVGWDEDAAVALRETSLPEDEA